MECNKEEAVRAREIAEKKMQTKDFVGARKIILKAQQLYPDLENICQMLIVCDVHCSAEQKLFGNEMDWYGILQVEQTSNEATIKKQYRKFALQLHPDKNKFSGAEAAFKLIGEAQRVLLDREKRALHDMKRRTSMSKSTAPYQPPHRTSWNSNAMSQNNVRSSFSGYPQTWQFQQSAQSAHSDVRPTFWTECPFCSIRYQYYKDVVNRSLRCQRCKKPFIAYDMNVQGAPPTTGFCQPVFPQQKGSASKKVETQWQQSCSAENSRAKSFQNSRKKGGLNSGLEKVNRKRERKQVSESSESSDSESSSESDQDAVIDENGDVQGVHNYGYFGEQNPRRSSRHKQQVSYKENLSDDDDFVSPPKKSKDSGSYHSTEGENEDASKEKESNINNQSNLDTAFRKDKKVAWKQSLEECVVNGGRTTQKDTRYKKPMREGDLKKSFKVHDNKDSISKGDSCSQIYNYPDPDFSNFQKHREVSCFAVGQTWAIYDVQNAMPRFYARIRKVLSPGFKVVIIWLEPDPDDEKTIKWLKRDLPFSCGKFRYGVSETTNDHLMFSHIVSSVKSNVRGCCKIYPRKGETWALFKNWDIKWNSDMFSHGKHEYEYEFVEILSEYVEDVGIYVALLEKVKGFECLFCRMVKGDEVIFQVPASQFLRFSHSIPSFKMTGDEGEGVPENSFELDPASLPTNLLSCSKSAHKPMMGCDKNASAFQNNKTSSHLHPQDDNSDDCIEGSPTSRNYEIPEPEFYNFDDDKSQEKFQIGQIWALYCDEDGLPKYYGQITDIDYSLTFTVHIAWLSSSFLPDQVIRWRDKDMPICCGRFRVVKSRTQAYDQVNSFSHRVRAHPANKRNEYAIYPTKGEVWALYRNWNAHLKCVELEKYEYDIVEVLEERDSDIKVLTLEPVDGFNSVFKPRVQEGSTTTRSIPLVELLKFSHQIPAFRLTEERNGGLKGFWELDPAALPVSHFSST